MCRTSNRVFIGGREKKRKKEWSEDGGGGGGDSHGIFCFCGNNFCWRGKTCWEAKFQVYFLFLAKSHFISVALE